MSIPSASNQRAIQTAMVALCSSLHADQQQVSLISCSQIQLPATPIPDGQSGISPVSYRYDILLAYHGAHFHYEVIGGRARFISQQAAP